MPPGDDRSVKIKSLEESDAKIMKIKWLALGCIEADLNNRWKAFGEIYIVKVYMRVHLSNPI